MPNYTDILLDENNEVRIANGDFVTGECEDQNAKLLLLSERGSWRSDVTKGIGLRRLVNAKLTGGLVLSLRKQIIGQFKADGSKVTKLTLTPTKFYLESERI